jgi:hypothetical protein
LISRKRVKGFWGHLVVVLPQLGWMIDPTIYQLREQEKWQFVPNVIAVPLQSDPEWLEEVSACVGYKPGKTVTSIEFKEGDYCFRVVWFDDPENQAWQRNILSMEDRRQLIADHNMIERFNEGRVTRPRPSREAEQEDDGTVEYDGVTEVIAAARRRQPGAEIHIIIKES